MKPIGGKRRWKNRRKSGQGSPMRTKGQGIVKDLPALKFRQKGPKADLDSDEPKVLSEIDKECVALSKITTLFKDTKHIWRLREVGEVLIKIQQTQGRRWRVYLSPALSFQVR
jgi:hypothetical protein